MTEFAFLVELTPISRH